MAVGVVNLTPRGRYTLVLIITFFLLSQTLLGVCITSWSIYMCTKVSPTLYSEKSEVTFVFTVTGMYGTHVIFHNLTGIKICQKCYAQAHKKSTRNLLFIWTLAGCNTILNIIILALLTVKICKHIVRSLRHTMEKGIYNYLKDPTWKAAIDKLQATMKCCGVISYEDWYGFTWIEEYHVDINCKAVKEFQIVKHRMYLPITPWSCCRTDYPLQCFHDPLQQTESAYIWKEQPEVVLESIHNRGCLALLKRPVEVALMGFIILTLIIFILHIVTVMLLRILYTSCRNALLICDGECSSAPGWICGRGDCGWSHGPGLYEIVQQDNHVNERLKDTSYQDVNNTYLNNEVNERLKDTSYQDVNNVYVNRNNFDTSTSKASITHSSSEKSIKTEEIVSSFVYASRPMEENKSKTLDTTEPMHLDMEFKPSISLRDKATSPILLPKHLMDKATSPMELVKLQKSDNTESCVNACMQRINQVLRDSSMTQKQSMNKKSIESCVNASLKRFKEEMINAMKDTIVQKQFMNKNPIDSCVEACLQKFKEELNGASMKDSVEKQKFNKERSTKDASAHERIANNKNERDMWIYESMQTLEKEIKDRSVINDRNQRDSDMQRFKEEMRGTSTKNLKAISDRNQRNARARASIQKEEEMRNVSMCDKRGVQKGTRILNDRSLIDSCVHECIVRDANIKQKTKGFKIAIKLKDDATKCRRDRNMIDRSSSSRFMKDARNQEGVTYGSYCPHCRYNPCPNKEYYNTVLQNESDEEPVSSNEEEALLLR